MPQQLVAVGVEDVLRFAGQLPELLDPRLTGALPDLPLPGVVERGLDPPPQLPQPLKIRGGGGGPPAARGRDRRARGRRRRRGPEEIEQLAHRRQEG